MKLEEGVKGGGVDEFELVFRDFYHEKVDVEFKEFTWEGFEVVFA